MTKHEQQQKNDQNQTANSKPESTHRIDQAPRMQSSIKPDVQMKKKIIKKFTFNSKITTASNNQIKANDDLKDWKPTSIGSAKMSSTIVKDANQSKKKQIFTNFLYSLPKPKDKPIDTEPANITGQSGLKKTHKQIFIKPTQQQLKWDAQDQFLIKNPPTYNKPQDSRAKPQNPIVQKVQHQQEKIQQISQKIQENQEMVDKITWLNEEKKQKVSNLADIVSKTWEKQGNFMDDNQIDSDESQSNKKKNAIKKNIFAAKFK